MDHDGLLTEFYGGTVSYGHSYSYYQMLLEQINHRHQNLDVLEVGQFDAFDSPQAPNIITHIVSKALVPEVPPVCS